MKPISTIPALLGLTLFLSTSCTKKTAEPQPAPTATYSRSVVYLDQASPARHDTTYQAQAVQVSATQDAAYITVLVKTGHSSQNFRLLRSQASGSLVGAYSLKTKQNYNLGDTDVSYTVDIPGTVGTIISRYNYTSLFNEPMGTFSITAYDAERQLLSGSFDTGFGSVNDPRVSDNTWNPRRCDIALRGTFAHISLKTSN